MMISMIMMITDPKATRKRLKQGNLISQKGGSPDGENEFIPDFRGWGAFAYL